MFTADFSYYLDSSEALCLDFVRLYPLVSFGLLNLFTVAKNTSKDVHLSSPTRLSLPGMTFPVHRSGSPNLKQ